MSHENTLESAIHFDALRDFGDHPLPGGLIQNLFDTLPYDITAPAGSSPILTQTSTTLDNGTDNRYGIRLRPHVQVSPANTIVDTNFIPATSFPQPEGVSVSTIYTPADTQIPNQYFHGSRTQGVSYGDTSRNTHSSAPNTLYSATLSSQIEDFIKQTVNTMLSRQVEHRINPVCSAHQQAPLPPPPSLPLPSHTLSGASSHALTYSAPTNPPTMTVPCSPAPDPAQHWQVLFSQPQGVVIVVFRLRWVEMCWHQYRQYLLGSSSRYTEVSTLILIIYLRPLHPRITI